MKTQRQQPINRRMDAEQLATYGKELLFNSSNPLENFVGEIMIEPAYTCKLNVRVSAAIRMLNAQRGRNEALDKVIDRVIAKIEGE